MCDSPCMWFIVKKLRYFEVILNIFEFSRVWKNEESWLIYANKLFLNCATIFLDWHNKTKLVPVFLVFFFVRLRFSCKFAFILFFSFLTNQMQEPGVQRVASLVTINISVFCLKPVTFYFKAMPNLIYFNKRIFLYAIPVRFIVAWLDWNV